LLAKVNRQKPSFQIWTRDVQRKNITILYHIRKNSLPYQTLALYPVIRIGSPKILMSD